MAAMMMTSSLASATVMSSSVKASRSSTGGHHQQKVVSSTSPCVPARVNGWGNDPAAAAAAVGYSRGRAELLVAHGRKGMLGRVIDGEEDESSKSRKEKKDKQKKDKAAAEKKGSDSLTGSMSGKGGANAGMLAVGNVNEDFKDKPIKALVLANGNFCLVKWEDTGDVYCTACNSTAYSYPLVDGELFFGPGGPAIRVPLDGTEYDLSTGEVITWCPKNNPVRQMLGALKKSVDPVPLPVYPVKIEADGTILTSFVKPE